VLCSERRLFSGHSLLARPQRTLALTLAPPRSVQGVIRACVRLCFRIGGLSVRLPQVLKHSHPAANVTLRRLGFHALPFLMPRDTPPNRAAAKVAHRAALFKARFSETNISPRAFSAQQPHTLHTKSYAS
jgi:hypothetical protein